ncbi:hypothetical protein L1049_021686 [Liquidambar formosana]|uniref:Uncharacterized protein n=1 Tax=Liquidambar formosana TaxID=63359 RepID=A0AAP0RBF9_LIQFO
MSIALERGGGNAIQRSGFIHGMSCISIYDSPEHTRPAPGVFAGERSFPAKGEEREEELELGSCSSSSIGRNSDVSGGSSDGDDSGETEVQSSFKGPLDTMDALEEVLPIRRGISKFYCGKSKSFTSLGDVSNSSSVKDLAKPENAYNRKRKNLLASSNFWDKSHNYPSRINGGGTSKRAANLSRSTLALGMTMSSSSGSNTSSEDSNSNSSSPPPCRPPLHPQSKRSPNSGSSSPPPRPNFNPMRSFSLSDLQCISPATPTITGLVISDRDKHSKLH